MKNTYSQRLNSITIQKENIVGTLSIVYGGAATAVGVAFTGPSGLAFLIFNLLCAPCFAAIGAIKREMNNGKWTAFAVTYQCVFAYVFALIVYQLGNLFTGAVSGFLGVVGVILAFILLGGFIYLIVRPNKTKKKAVLEGELSEEIAVTNENNED